MRIVFVAIASLATLCGGLDARAEPLPYRSSLANRHHMIYYLGSSKPISDAHAACLKPVNAALFKALQLLTTLKPKGAYDPAIPERKVQKTDALIAEFVALIEKADWVEQPAAALNGQRDATVPRQKAAHDTLLGFTLARGENAAVRLQIEQLLARTDKTGGITAAKRTELQKSLTELDGEIKEMQEEALKQAALANVLDSIVGYVDCELAQLKATGR